LNVTLQGFHHVAERNSREHRGQPAGADRFNFFPSKTLALIAPFD